MSIFHCTKANFTHKWCVLSIFVYIINNNDNTNNKKMPSVDLEPMTLRIII